MIKKYNKMKQNKMNKCISKQIKAVVKDTNCDRSFQRSL